MVLCSGTVVGTVHHVLMVYLEAMMRAFEDLNCWPNDHGIDQGYHNYM
jgi:hypothetical protein